jgi:hypothetical protein
MAGSSLVRFVAPDRIVVMVRMAALATPGQVPVGIAVRVGEDRSVTETPTEPQESSASGPTPRGRETVGDMARSMSLVLVVVAVVVLLTVRANPQQKVQQVDYRLQLQETRRIAAYDVLAPVGLGDTWKATSARGDNVDGVVTWHLGLVTPAEHYAAVEQSDGPATAFVDDFVAGATRSGVVTVSGVRWQRLDGGKPERRALLLPGRGVTTMVTGSATFAELRTLASALRGG